MEKAKLKIVGQWFLGALIAFPIIALSSHYIRGYSWDYILRISPWLIPIGLAFAAVRYMRRWFTPRD